MLVLDFFPYNFATTSKFTVTCFKCFNCAKGEMKRYDVNTVNLSCLASGNDIVNFVTRNGVYHSI